MLRERRSDSEGDDKLAPALTSGVGLTSSEAFPAIEGYDLLRQLGRGGSATVYLARERKHDRLVALKVLHPALAASLQAERFLNEIAYTARLAHPNILPLLDSGRAGDLLYFVTPYVPGESLRERLQREGKLPVPDAIRLAIEVANGLDYAHRQRLVHRDIKPENILLADGHALVADFGIARALNQAADKRLTIELAPGTPPYMSPEQIRGDAGLDSRSDVYSLGCVCYELLTGHPPFDGDSLQEIATKHLNAEVPPFPAALGIPPQVERIVRTALAKSPGDRFPTAASVSKALSGGAVTWPVPPAPLPSRSSRWPRRSVAGAAALATLALAIRAGSTPEVLPPWKRALIGAGVIRLNLDTTVYVVAGSDSGPTTREIVEQLRQAFGRWRELSVEGESEVRAAAGSTDPFSNRGFERAAISLGAGRYVRVSTSRSGDSVSVSATIHDTRRRERLATRSMVVRRTGQWPEGVFRGLTDSLLFRAGVPADRADGAPGTNSLFARHLYFRGHGALAAGDFRLADSLFARSVALDEGYPQALAWLAVVRSWTSATPGLWQQLPVRALARRTGLDTRDSILLEAVRAMAEQDRGRACAAWRELAGRWPSDFAAWYGLGSCERNDYLVVRYRTGPYSWRFRSSYHDAVRSFERAFRLRPAMLLGYGGKALRELRLLMATSGNFMREGYALTPDSVVFKGYPIWESDSLVVVPLQGAEILRGPASASIDVAVQRQRQRFRDIASLWRSEFPRSPDALEGLAIALEMLGDESSLDTLHLGRALAVDPEDRARLGAHEVLMRLKFSVPSNEAGLATAKSLADSLLRAFPPGTTTESQLLGSLAALTGRAGLAAAYARETGAGAASLTAIFRNGPALLAFAALGGPADSLRVLETAVESGAQSLPTSERSAVRQQWLVRAAALAFPDARLSVLPDSGETGLRAGNLIVSALTQDHSRLDQILESITASREQLRIRPSDISADALLQEASALAHVGETERAIQWLDPTLQALRFVTAQDLGSGTRTGPLVRSMALRATLAAQRGDPVTARPWANAVAVLWADADLFLQPVVRRMRDAAMRSASAGSRSR